MFQKQPEQTRTRGELFREELGQTVDHAMRAAGHAAGGLREARTRMAPAAGRFRDAASQRWAEFNRAAGEPGSAVRGVARGRGWPPRQARRMPAARRSTSRMGLLIAGGAALGVIAAMVMRRRRQLEWEGYEAGRMMEPAGQEPASADIGVAPPEPMMMSDPAATGSAPGMEEEEERTGRPMTSPPS